MTQWELVWKEGFQPLYSTEELRRLLAALREDHPRLVQGTTTVPPPLTLYQHATCQGADAVAFPCVEWDETEVGECEEFFAKKCFDADQRLGEPAECRYWLNWYDYSPRSDVFALLTKWVEEELLNRGTEPEMDPALTLALAADPKDWQLRLAVSDYYRERDCERLADYYAELATTLKERK